VLVKIVNWLQLMWLLFCSERMAQSCIRTTLLGVYRYNDWLFCDCELFASAFNTMSAVFCVGWLINVQKVVLVCDSALQVAVGATVGRW